jgi:hypothetical protein
MIPNAYRNANSISHFNYGIAEHLLKDPTQCDPFVKFKPITPGIQAVEV